MFGDRRPRHLKRRGQFTDRRVAVRELSKNCPPGSVGECTERPVEAERYW